MFTFVASIDSNLVAIRPRLKTLGRRKLLHGCMVAWNIRGSFIHHQVIVDRSSVIGHRTQVSCHANDSWRFAGPRRGRKNGMKSDGALQRSRSARLENRRIVSFSASDEHLQTKRTQCEHSCRQSEARSSKIEIKANTHEPGHGQHHTGAYRCSP